MTKRITAALLALCLALALAACGKGSEPELNIDELGEELYAAGDLRRDALSAGRIRGPGALRHGCGHPLLGARRLGATAEELAVFETKDADAAAALAKKLETRNADRIENYSSYIPAEVPKLENAVILSGGRYVVLCVAEDASAVREAAEKALG